MHPPTHLGQARERPAKRRDKAGTDETSYESISNGRRPGPHFLSFASSFTSHHSTKGLLAKSTVAHALLVHTRLIRAGFVQSIVSGTLKNHQLVPTSSFSAPASSPLPGRRHQHHEPTVAVRPCVRPCMEPPAAPRACERPRLQPEWHGLERGSGE